MLIYFARLKNDQGFNFHHPLTINVLVLLPNVSCANIDDRTKEKQPDSISINVFARTLSWYLRQIYNLS